MNVKTLAGSLLIVPGLLLLSGASSLSPARNALGFQGISTNPPIPKQAETGPVARFPLDGNLENAVERLPKVSVQGRPSFVDGLDGGALVFDPESPSSVLTIGTENLPLGSSQDFSVQFWIRTVVDTGRQFVVLSQKDVQGQQPGFTKGARVGVLCLGRHLGLEYGFRWPPDYL